MRFTPIYQEVFNGEFAPGQWNLLMAFQVNCPGCFQYGFPLLTELQAFYRKRLSCFALSTAFEDFELNTAANTRRLVDNGELVGETKKAMEQSGQHWNAASLSVPVLMDEIVSQSELLQPAFIDFIIQNMPGEDLTDQDENELRTGMREYFNMMPGCGKSFVANMMRGTPSFFLFDQSMDIHLQWFGHGDIQMIKNELDKVIPGSHG